VKDGRLEKRKCRREREREREREGGVEEWGNDLRLVWVFEFFKSKF
jgi:hypothetical protein